MSLVSRTHWQAAAPSCPRVLYQSRASKCICFERQLRIGWELATRLGWAPSSLPNLISRRWRRRRGTNHFIYIDIFNICFPLSTLNLSLFASQSLKNFIASTNTLVQSTYFIASAQRTVPSQHPASDYPSAKSPIIWTSTWTGLLDSWTIHIHTS